MLPPVILMHMLTSSHLESYFGGLRELPSKECPRDFSQKSWFYGSFPCPYGAPSRGPLGALGVGSKPAKASSASTRTPPHARLGSAWLARLRFGWLCLGFRPDFGWSSGGFWLRLDFGLILVWFGLGWICLDLA